MPYFKDYFLTEMAKVTGTLKREFPNVRFVIDETDDYIDLRIFVVVYKDRHKGIGTKFINRLKELADESNKTIYLTPDDSYAEDGEMTKKDLERWYKKLGFVDKPKNEPTNNTLKYN
jgi:GNAT superfamily N-acetyltransferase